MLKTPITYYGGKQRLASVILGLIPEHRLYTEAFCGGAAVFWAKTPSKLECINDQNEWVVTFYRVLKNNYPILRKLIQETAVSRSVHRRAEFVLKNSKNFNEIEVAWAFWVQCNLSFSSNIFAGYGYDKLKGACVKKIYNKKIAFTKALQHRLNHVDIECNDAIKVITSRDCEDAFHYVDPPYYNACMGHYDGYTENDFKALLKALAEVKGKFLLSSYNSELLSAFTIEMGWYKREIVQPISASKTRGLTKVEVLTANYPIA